MSASVASRTRCSHISALSSRKTLFVLSPRVGHPGAMADMLDRPSRSMAGLRPATYPRSMLTQLANVTLNEHERRVVERLVARLREKVGGRLLAVWLYGSRARGDADPEETDPDLRSDIDLLAIVDSSLKVEDARLWVQPMVEAEADAEGDSPVYYSLRIFDTEWLRSRRKVQAFFIQEVDRDKVVLFGQRLDGAEYR
jgi:predicted nucleotidyltransferase